jgi:hypothetical protein
MSATEIPLLDIAGTICGQAWQRSEPLDEKQRGRILGMIRLLHVEANEGRAAGVKLYARLIDRMLDQMLGARLPEKTNARPPVPAAGASGAPSTVPSMIPASLPCGSRMTWANGAPRSGRVP